MRQSPPVETHIRPAFLILTLLVIVGLYPTSQTLPQSPSHIAALNGIEMYYEIHGAGPPLILLHGFAGSGHVWKPFVADFAKHYQVIVPDLRGHGRSTNPANQFTFRQSALDVYALLGL